MDVFKLANITTVTKEQKADPVLHYARAIFSTNTDTGRQTDRPPTHTPKRTHTHTQTHTDKHKDREKGRGTPPSQACP